MKRNGMLRMYSPVRLLLNINNNYRYTLISGLIFQAMLYYEISLYPGWTIEKLSIYL